MPTVDAPETTYGGRWRRCCDAGGGSGAVDTPPATGALKTTRHPRHTSFRGRVSPQQRTFLRSVANELSRAPGVARCRVVGWSGLPRPSGESFINTPGRPDRIPRSAVISSTCSWGTTSFSLGSGTSRSWDVSASSGGGGRKRLLWLTVQLFFDFGFHIKNRLENTTRYVRRIGEIVFAHFAIYG